MENTLLSHLTETAQRAHNWTSFSPERRGTQMIQDYSEELAADLEELRSHADVSEESVTDYKNRYERLFTSYLHAKSNCFSAMITGPAKFNNRKHEKANRSEERHYEVFREWRERAKKAIVRKSQPVKTYVSELDRYKAELASMKRNQEIMKASNAVIRKAKGKDCTAELVAVGLSENNAKKIQLPDFCGRIGFASFSTTNNLANIKRVEDRIQILEAKEAKRNEEPEKSYTFDGGEVVMNYEADRIQIFFTNRPTTQELNDWKAKGLNSFNWSPSAKAWQRKITPNAMYATKRMFAGKLTA